MVYISGLHATGKESPEIWSNNPLEWTITILSNKGKKNSPDKIQCITLHKKNTIVLWENFLVMPAACGLFY